ncbi:unnamed protein product [Mytilus edulis]|uniref:Uncharacterized protein n=1 Tax=Mytilus edulis TaxID=6550 RepID=A0A8S3TYT6_MYTED|nr:unnamed protein product [Mytilus edulis]
MFFITEKTSLHVTNNKDVAEILIQNGANVNSRDRYVSACKVAINQTPLHLTKNIEIAEILIQSGADVNSRDIIDDSPLHAAVSCGKYSMVEILNCTPLHVAVSNCDRQVIDVLLSANANVNAIDDEKWTPLHLAASEGYSNVTIVLVNANANVNAINNEGKTPCDLAEIGCRINNNTKSRYEYQKTFDYLKGKMDMLGSCNEQSSAINNSKTASSIEYSLQNTAESADTNDKNIQLPWLVDAIEFQRMLSRGEYLSYENRLSLGGPCRAGKSTLISILIGQQIPLQWNSTDGLVIYFGRNGIDIDKQKMVPLQEGMFDIWRDRDMSFCKNSSGMPNVETDSEQIIIQKTTTIRSVNTEVQALLTAESPTKYTQDNNKTIKYSTDQFATKANVAMNKHVKKHFGGTQMPRKACLQQLQKSNIRLQEAATSVRYFRRKHKVVTTNIHGLHIISHFITAILKLWVDSVLTYAEDTDDIMPMILFAATHRDQCKTIRPDFYYLRNHGERTICLEYSLAQDSIPSALAYKVIGAAIITWPLKEENRKPCLYHKAAVLNVTEDDELHIWFEDNRVMVYLTNQKSLLSISPDVAASVQECFTKNIEMSLLFYFNSFGKKIKPTKVLELYTLALGVPCGTGVCFRSAQELNEGDFWKCENDKRHATKYLLYWIFDKSQNRCAHNCKGLSNDELRTEPSDKHLVRMGSQIGIHLFEEFFIHLGMTTRQWENTVDLYGGHSREGIMSMALVKWKESKLSDFEEPTLKDLTDALAEVNLDKHAICQVFREDTKLPDITDCNLQQTPSDDVLKELSNRVGNCALQLGIELGVSFSEVENSFVKFPKDLPGLIEDILIKWKAKSKIKTFCSLMLALKRVNGGGVTYLHKMSKMNNAYLV